MKFLLPALIALGLALPAAAFADDLVIHEGHPTHHYHHVIHHERHVVHHVVHHHIVRHHIVHHEE